MAISSPPKPLMSSSVAGWDLLGSALWPPCGYLAATGEMTLASAARHMGQMEQLVSVNGKRG